MSDIQALIGAQTFTAISLNNPVHGKQPITEIHCNTIYSQHFTPGLLQLGVSTSCTRLSKTLPEISKKVAQKLLKKSQKLLFVRKVSQKLLQKKKHKKKTKQKMLLLSSFIWSDAKVRQK